MHKVDTALPTTAIENFSETLRAQSSFTTRFMIEEFLRSLRPPLYHDFFH